MLTIIIIGLILLGIVGVVRIIIYGLYLMLPLFILIFIGAFLFNPWAVIAFFIISMAIMNKKRYGRFGFRSPKRRFI